MQLLKSSTNYATDTNTGKFSYITTPLVAYVSAMTLAGMVWGYFEHHTWSHTNRNAALAFVNSLSNFHLRVFAL